MAFKWRNHPTTLDPTSFLSSQPLILSKQIESDNWRNSGYCRTVRVGTLLITPSPCAMLFFCPLYGRMEEFPPHLTWSGVQDEDSPFMKDSAMSALFWKYVWSSIDPSFCIGVSSCFGKSTLIHSIDQLMTKYIQEAAAPYICRTIKEMCLVPVMSFQLHSESHSCFVILGER